VQEGHQQVIQGPRRQASRFATKGLAFRMGRRPFSCVPLKHRQEFDRHACSRRHQQLHTQPHMQPHTTACVSRETQATFTRNGKATTTQRQSQRN
ncbi:MAG: hypothetical protein ACLT4Y_08600, partial [Bifidobacterium breve]